MYCNAQCISGECAGVHRSMYNVQCISCECTMYNVQCISCECTMYNVQCISGECQGIMPGPTTLYTKTSLTTISLTCC